MREPKTVTPKVIPAHTVQQTTGHTNEFVHVSFCYPGTTRDPLHDVSFTIHPGEALALIGLIHSKI